jgi:multidrug resistance efflux pump
MKGKEISEEFFNMFNKLKEECKEAQKMVSKIDKELSNIYHKIEGATIKHVSESHKLIKELKEVLDRRRELKYNAMVLRTMVDNLEEKVGQAINKVNQVTDKHNLVVKEIEDLGKKT